MDVGTFCDGSQWHRLLREIGRWRFARCVAETRRHEPPTSASPRLGGSFFLMDVGTFRDGLQWHCLLGEIDWVENRPRSRSDAET